MSNAGIGGGGGVDAPDEVWQRIWEVNVMAHVYAARAVLPAMLARGEGYLLNTASAAGLLTNIGDAPYSVTKHAAVGLAEWLAITYGDQGIKVSCLCPQGVRTNMLLAGATTRPAPSVLAQGAIEPEEVAEAVVEGLRAEDVPDPPPPRGAHLLPAQGRRLRPLARRHAPAPGAASSDARRDAAASPTPAALTESALLEVGLRPGDRVRFRRSRRRRVEGGAGRAPRARRLGRRARRARRGPGHPGRAPPGAQHRAHAAARSGRPWPIERNETSSSASGEASARRALLASHAVR